MVTGSGKTSVDANQLQAELQRCFDAVGKRSDTSEDIALGLLELNKLTLCALLDLNLIQHDRLITAFETLKSQRSTQMGQAIFDGLITSFNKSHGEQAAARGPHLRLVPTPNDSTPPPKDPD
ncbi:hypothetical protein O4H61_03400 [Roseovarius aestuarii]|nr:hypothetical protein [Roseovarius aestuarii]